MKHLPPSTKRSHRLAAARAKAIAASHSHQSCSYDGNNENGKPRTTSILSLRWIVTFGCSFGVAAFAFRSNGLPKMWTRARQVGAEACNSTSIDSKGTITMWNGYFIPPLSSPFGEYPNPLDVTDEDRKSFHPVVMFPKIWVDVPVTDSSEQSPKSKPRRQQVWDVQVWEGTDASRSSLLATDQMRQERRLLKKRPQSKEKFYAIGRYDENRVGLYTSELFQNGSNQIEGFKGTRTLHVGIDLDGPVGTKVFAFADGIIHAAGYNPDLGDYGNVIVVEHDLGAWRNTTTTTTKTTITTLEEGSRRKVWALYGHLDDNSIKGKSTGKRIRKGQVLGRMGDFHENGGWLLPHVHFQLSIHPPESHDLPGAVALQDRPRALIEYPDPRWILGPLY